MVATIAAASIALLSGCGGDGTAASELTGSIRVTSRTTGTEIDPDGYVVKLDGGNDRPLATNGELTIAGVAAGAHTVSVGGIAANCSLDGESSRSIELSERGAVSVLFAVACAAFPSTGTIHVAVQTTGADPDPNGYALVLDGGTGTLIGPNATTQLPSIAAGNHSLTLGDVASNCTVDGTNPVALSVVAGETVSINFSVSCSILPLSDVIVFVSDRGATTAGLWRMSSTGTGAALLTANAEMPAISPDGTRIAFIRDPVGTYPYTRYLFVMRADGTGATQITATAAENPAWSPDGSKIAFDRAGHIFVVNADGSGQSDLTAGDTHANAHPSWSPDGRRIVFHSNRDGDYDHIFIMNADGSGVTQVTSGDADDLVPEWSPTADQITFVSRRNGPYNIYVMDIAGGIAATISRLTTGAVFDYNPAWSRDGLKIAYNSSDAGNPEIMTMNADGSRKVRLTFSTAIDQQPAWR